jgi:FkbM family methyltransferase
MLLFDIGANRGDAVVAGLNKGYKVVALEAAPKIYRALEANFINNPNVKPLRFAVAEKDFQTVKFYECIEDGLSTLNIDWLTSDTMPYNGKQFSTVEATTITVDTLVKLYGAPNLMKIDVEGAEWSVFYGMTQKYGTLTFEWTDVTLDEHCNQLEYLKNLGYTEVGPQFIEHHLQEPAEWFPLDGFDFCDWVREHKDEWTNGGWKGSHLRPTADVGMCWVR